MSNIISLGEAAKRVVQKTARQVGMDSPVVKEMRDSIAMDCQRESRLAWRARKRRKEIAATLEEMRDEEDQKAVDDFLDFLRSTGGMWSG